jgi:hypothetical protein
LRAVADGAAAMEGVALGLRTRLEPPHQERLDEARRQLSALLGTDLNNTEILNGFFADTFEAWFQAQLSAAKRKRPRRPSGGEGE